MLSSAYVYTNSFCAKGKTVSSLRQRVQQTGAAALLSAVYRHFAVAIRHRHCRRIEDFGGWANIYIFIYTTDRI